MSDLADYIQRVFFDPTDPVTVVQDTAANLKAQVELAADQTIEATQDDPEDLKVEIHQPAAKEEFEVVQPTAADLKATVTQAAKDRTVTNPTPANLKAEVTPAATAEFLNYPRIPTAATQVRKNGYADNGTHVTHIVDSEKTLYLTAAFLNAYNAAGAPTYARLGVRNDQDQNQYEIFHIHIQDAQHGRAMLSFNPPLEIPASWDVYTYSPAAGMRADSLIHGYEV